MANFFTKLFTGKKKRSYEAASKKKRLKRWLAPSSSQNSETAISLDILRNRSRDLIRNNPLAFKGVNVITSNVVGHGIKTKFLGAGSERIQEVWDKWSTSSACDFNDMFSFGGMQGVVMKAIVESGEVLIRKRIDSSAEFPLQYQILESDFLASGINTTNENPTVQGVELDPNGRVVAYHLYESHPGDALSSHQFTNVNALAVNRFDKSEMHHVFRVDRPGQLRGVPWIAPIIVRLKDVDEFIDATIMKQKVAACFAGFVTDMSADLVDPEAMRADNSQVSEAIEPGVIEELPIGKDIKFPNPPSVEHFKEFQSILGHNIASGLGISYEALTGDLSEVNFSSARMGWIEMGRNIDQWRNCILQGMFIDKVAKDFLEVFQMTTGLNTSSITWTNTPPRREMIDPVKETNAIIKMVRGGMISLSEAISASGKDPQKVFEQIREDNELLDSLGIVLDSDPRQITQAGITQPEEVNNNDNEE